MAQQHALYGCGQPIGVSDPNDQRLYLYRLKPALPTVEEVGEEIRRNGKGQCRNDRFWIIAKGMRRSWRIPFVERFPVMERAYFRMTFLPSTT